MAISSSISRYYNQPVNKIGENVFYLEDEYVLDESPTDLTTYVRESEVNRIDLLSVNFNQILMYTKNGIVLSNLVIKDNYNLDNNIRLVESVY